MKRFFLIMVTWLILMATITPLALAKSGQQEKRGLAIILSGGPGLFNGGDWNGMIKDWKTFFLAQADNPQEGFYWPEIKSGVGFGAEILYYFSDQLALGLGLEYWKKKNQGQINLTSSNQEQGIIDSYPYEYSLESSLAFNPSNTLSILPLTLSAYYFLPINQHFQAFFKAGLVYYFGRLKSTYDYVQEENEELILYDPDDGSLLDSYLSEEKYTYGYSDRVKGQNLGFQGGMGLEIKVLPRLNFRLELVYRQADLKSWKGSGIESLTYKERYGSVSTGFTENTERESQSPSGRLAFITYSDGTSIIALGDLSEPDSRRAVIKLSGPVLRAGLKMRF